MIRSLRAVALTAMFSFCLPVLAVAQSFPDRPIRLVVPYPPGGTADAVGRMMAEAMSKLLPQPVVVENRSGSGGMIGAESVARSTPDGHTLLLGLNGPISINPAIRASMPYDPLKDFAPLTLICEIPGLLGVPTSLPANSIADLVAMERARAGSVSFASQGIGTTGHLTGELVNVLGNVSMTHVPYRGTAQAMGDLLSGRVQSTWDLPTVLIPQRESGRMRIIAVATRERLPELPDVATVVEQGFPTLAYATWVGMLAPAGTPQPILERLNTVNQQILADPAVRQRLVSFGARASGIALGAYREYLTAEIAKWRDVAQRAQVRVE